MQTNATLAQRLVVALFVLFIAVSPVSAVHAAETSSTTPVVVSTVVTSTVTTPDDTVSVKDVETTPAVVEVAPSAKIQPLQVLSFDMTAYTSTPEECDSDPFTTADGSHVRDGIIATNVLPFGTKVRFPSVFGDRIFEVHDRMNKRYSMRADVWMSNAKDMRQFGIKHSVRVEVVEWGNPKNTPFARQAQEYALKHASSAS